MRDAPVVVRAAIVSSAIALLIVFVAYCHNFELTKAWSFSRNGLLLVLTAVRLRGASSIRSGSGRPDGAVP